MNKLLKRSLLRLVTRQGKNILISREKFNEQLIAYEYQLDRSGDLPISSQTKERYDLVTRLQGTQFGEAYEIISALHKTSHMSGAVCEFGVAQGETSALIAHEIASDGRDLHLFDSFEGLPRPTEQDQLKDDIFNLGSMDAYEGQMSVPIEAVKSRLKDIGFPEGRTIIHKGFFNDIINEPKQMPAEISFAYVDFDLYEPIKEVLNFVKSTIQVNGIIIVDDYDWFSTGAKTAVDEFLTKENAVKTVYNFEVASNLLGHFCILRRTE